MRSPESRRQHGFVNRYLAVSLTVGLGIFVTAVVFVELRSLEHRSLENRFVHLAELHATVWIDALEDRLGILDSLYALYESSDHVTRDEFRLFTERSVLRYEGIETVWWVPCVPAEARYAFEQQARHDGLERFRIIERVGHPADEPGLAAHLPIYYAEPPTPSVGLLGLDLASDPSWREPLSHATDTGEPVVTTDVNAPNADPNAETFCVVRSVYRRSGPTATVADRREDLQGFIIAILDFGRMAKSSLLSSASEGIMVELLRTTTAGLQPLHVRPTFGRPSPPTNTHARQNHTSLVWEKPLDLGHEQWTIRCRSTQVLFDSHRSLASLAGLGIGLVITCLVSSHVWSHQVRYERVARLVAERTHELTASREELKSINGELRDFAHVVSHDLKAPLRGIRTLAEWIEGDFSDRLGDEGREQVHLLMGRVDRMHGLIDGILEYSRIGRVCENRVAIDMNRLLVDLASDLAIPERISLDVEGGLPTVYAEPIRIRQLFQNLLSNAMKYLDKERGSIRVGCSAEPDRWRFFVADNGPGIEEKHFQRIFQLFQTLSPRDQIESTGIGLTVAKKIVEHHGGRIWVASRMGEGSTFFFTLPKTRPEAIDADRKAAVAG